MVAAFLRAEIESRRHVKYLLPPELSIAETILRRRLILQPDLADERENELRRQLLAYRGYRRNLVLFNGYPEGTVEWHRARMSIEELRRVKYARHETWVDLSEGTRLAEDGAKNVVPGGDNPSQDIFDIARLFEDEHSFSELIFLGEPDAPVDELVLLEGHCRATGYIVAANRNERTRDRSEDVLIGSSPRIREWIFFGDA